MYQSALLALFFTAVLFRVSAAEVAIPQLDVPEGYGPSSTLVLNADRAQNPQQLRDLLHVAHNIHVKWVPGEEKSHSYLLHTVFETINQLKQEENNAWHPVGQPDVPHITVLVEPSNRQYLGSELGAKQCVADIRWLDDVVWAAGRGQNFTHFTYWTQDKMFKRHITVLLSAPVPAACYDTILARQMRRPNMYVGVNPHIGGRTPPVIKKDSVKLIPVYTRVWPSSRDVLFEYINTLPEGTRLRLTDIPEGDGKTNGQIAVVRRIFEVMASVANGRLLYSVEYPEAVKTETDGDTGVVENQDEKLNPDIPIPPPETETEIIEPSDKQRFLQVVNWIAVFEALMLFAMALLALGWYADGRFRIVHRSKLPLLVTHVNTEYKPLPANPPVNKTQNLPSPKPRGILMSPGRHDCPSARVPLLETSDGSCSEQYTCCCGQCC